MLGTTQLRTVVFAELSNWQFGSSARTVVELKVRVELELLRRTDSSGRTVELLSNSVREFNFKKVLEKNSK